MLLVRREFDLIIDFSWLMAEHALQSPPSGLKMGRKAQSFVPPVAKRHAIEKFLLHNGRDLFVVLSLLLYERTFAKLGLPRCVNSVALLYSYLSPNKW